jgi:hypothetical protein
VVMYMCVKVTGFSFYDNPNVKMCPLVAILNFELRSVVCVQIIHNKKVSFVISCNGDGDLHIFPIHKCVVMFHI